MGERTGITYCDHTFSPWWGCTKVSPGCGGCYAERVGNQHGIKWGPGQPRAPVAASTWKLPLRWARAARKAGETRRVLVSMCDYLDPEAPEEWRQRFYDLVRETADDLDWMLLTKRSHLLDEVPVDVSMAAWMGVTVESGAYAFRIQDLRRVPALRTWISYEPALGPLNLLPHLNTGDGLEYIDLVIAGCESGAKARPADTSWFRTVRDQCLAAGVNFYLKQMAIDGKVVKLPELGGLVWDLMPEGRP